MRKKLTAYFLMLAMLGAACPVAAIEAGEAPDAESVLEETVETPAAPEEESVFGVEDDEEPVIPEEPAEELTAEPAEEPEAELEEEPQTDAAAPTITGLTLEVGGETYAADFHGGSMYVSIPAELTLSGAAVSMTTSEAVVFVPKTNAADGELYAAEATESSVGLNFNLSVGGEDLNGAAYRITLITDDQMEWSGTIGSAFNVPTGTLAAGLSAQENAGLAAGTMKSAATGAEGEARALYCNQDARNVQVVFCPTDAAVRTVVYDCGDTVYTWKVPNGLPLQSAAAPELSGKTFDAWYLDEDCETAAGIGEAVTADMTLYAGYTDNVVAGSFAGQVASDAMILTISNLTDFEAFMELAGDIKAGRLVRLTDDIDCGGKTYTAITGFKENFDGNNKTISNATFKASGDNSGMFATIGAGQKVANLTMSGVTVKNATNAGVLAGSINGAEGHRTLIRNVQIVNCSVSGRNAGGLAGYAFVSDIWFCSNQNTTVTGIVNGGGIAGISYSVVSNCYATKSATALKSAGGIVGKNLESSFVEWCWCTALKVAGYSAEGEHEANNVPRVTSTMSASAFSGFDTRYWKIARGMNTTFIPDAVFYEF